MPEVIRVRMKDNSKTIELKVGETFQIELPENLSTGYIWEFATPLDSSILELVQDKYLVTEVDKEILGAGETRLLVFRIKGTGESKVELRLWQPWSGEESIASKFSISVHAKQHVATSTIT